jgi:hypothetical protein
MESAIAADLAWPGPLSHAPECECGCDRTVDGDWMIHRGSVYRGDCFLLLEDPPRCLYCGAEMKSGNFCDPDCFAAWERRGLEEEEADFKLRERKGD